MSDTNKETTHIRIHRVDMKRIWDLISFERKTIADVITYLLDQYEQKPILVDSPHLEAKNIA